MHDTGMWVICAVLAWLIVAVIFGKSKPTWHPFGGMFKRDRKTGAITMALTLPTRKSARKGRRR
jgi:hypothetical protein